MKMHRLTDTKLEILNERTLSIITHQALANQSTPGSGHEPTNTQRRTFIGGALAAFHTYRCSFVPRARKKIRPDLVISRCGKRDSTRSATMRLS